MVLWKTVENALLCNIFNVQVLATPAMILRKLLLHDSELQKDELIRYYKRGVVLTPALLNHNIYHLIYF